MTEQSTPKLLEHYTLGEVFSNKNGIRCYPATDNRTGKRYVAKVQKIPYSPSVTEAFLLSGAFEDAEEMNEYYSSLAKDLCRQAAILNALSYNDCFSHFTSCETIKCKDIGYEVWLISSYRNTLATLFGKIQLSKNKILELGITLCRGLRLCREAGFLYTGIKPENIYISEDGKFTIGDIGFIPLSSLPFATLPLRHHSAYTPADNHDCFSHISDNLDVYGVGVVLYQALSGGKLPEKITEPPQNADKEIADIIMTACAPSTGSRWKTPSELEAALSACIESRNS